MSFSTKLCRFLRNSTVFKRRILFNSQQVCLFCQKSDSDDKKTFYKTESLGKFKEFKDEEAIVVLDVEEEKIKASQEEQIVEVQVPVERGVTGVFDLPELISLLNESKAENIFVAQLPPELNYVNYFVVITGRSKRHIYGMGETVRKLYKRKRHQDDIIPRIEGEDTDWIALDLGNIALHIMSDKARKVYDLESLWGIGAKYDTQLNSADNELLELLKKHTLNLDDLQPH